LLVELEKTTISSRNDNVVSSFDLRSSSEARVGLGSSQSVGSSRSSVNLSTMLRFSASKILYSSRSPLVGRVGRAAWVLSASS